MSEHIPTGDGWLSGETGLARSVPKQGDGWHKGDGWLNY
jgi:hypothetical protein